MYIISVLLSFLLVYGLWGVVPIKAFFFGIATFVCFSVSLFVFTEIGKKAWKK